MTTHRSKFHFHALAALSLFAMSACQTAAPAEPDAPREGFSLIGGAGQAYYDSSTDASSGFTGSVDDSDTAFNVGVAYRFGPMFSAELAYTDLGELTYDGVFMGTPDSGSISATAVEANGVFHYPFAGRWEAIVEAGLVYWDAEEKEVFGGVPEPGDSDSDVSAKAGLGIQVRILDPLALRVSYDRYFAVWDEDIDVLLARLVFSF